MMSFVAGILSGIIASMGLGGGAVLLLYLVYLKETPQLTAQGINRNSHSLSPCTLRVNCI